MIADPLNRAADPVADDDGDGDRRTALPGCRECHRVVFLADLCHPHWLLTKARDFREDEVSHTQAAHSSRDQASKHEMRALNATMSLPERAAIATEIARQRSLHNANLETLRDDDARSAEMRRLLTTLGIFTDTDGDLLDENGVCFADGVPFVARGGTVEKRGLHLVRKRCSGCGNTWLSDAIHNLLDLDGALCISPLPLPLLLRHCDRCGKATSGASASGTEAVAR